MGRIVKQVSDSTTRYSWYPGEKAEWLPPPIPAGAAVLIANLPARGFAANWLLPIVPAAIGALAHQAGMLWEQLARASAPVAGSRTASRQAPLTGPVVAASPATVTEEMPVTAEM